MRLETTAVSLYFLIQVLGRQLGSAQIKDTHPQSVLSSRQWHALVLPPSLSFTLHPATDTHPSSQHGGFPLWDHDVLSCFPCIEQPRSFRLSVLIALWAVGGETSDKALFSTVWANTTPSITLTDRPKVTTKRFRSFKRDKGPSVLQCVQEMHVIIKTCCNVESEIAMQYGFNFHCSSWAQLAYSLFAD